MAGRTSHCRGNLSNPSDSVDFRSSLICLSPFRARSVQLRAAYLIPSRHFNPDVDGFCLGSRVTHRFPSSRFPLQPYSVGCFSDLFDGSGLETRKKSFRRIKRDPLVCVSVFDLPLCELWSRCLWSSASALSDSPRSSLNLKQQPKYRHL